MRPVNCGVFDEKTGLCLHCGKAAEGPQCEVDLKWTLLDILYGAARLLYGKDALPPISNDRGALHILLSIGGKYDPLRENRDTYTTLYQLVRYHRIVLRFTPDPSQFILSPDQAVVSYRPRTPDGLLLPDQQSYSMLTRHSNLTHAVVVSACKTYLASNGMLWPKNLQNEYVSIL